MSEKSTLKILDIDGKIYIKKKPSIKYIIYFVLSALLLMFFFLLSVSELIDSLAFGCVSILFYIIIFATVFKEFLHTFVGKITLDINNKELYILYIFKRQINFHNIKRISVYHRERYRSLDVSGAEIFLNNEEKILFYTRNKKQAEEIKEFIKSYIHIENEKEENKDEL